MSLQVTPTSSTPDTTALGNQPSPAPSNPALPKFINIYGESFPLDVDLSSAVTDITNSDLPAASQALIIDILRIMAHIRRSAILSSDKQAVTGLEQGMQAAEAQKSQARSQANAELVSHSASLGQAVGEVAMHSIQLKNTASEVNKVKTQAANMSFPAANQPADLVRPADAPPAYSAKGDTDFDSKGLVASADNKGNVNNPATNGGVTNAPIQDESARERFINDRTRSIYAKHEMETHLGSASLTAVASVLKMIASAETVKAGEFQAQATTLQALQQYAHQRGQFHDSEAEQARASIAAALEFWRQAEQARHQYANTLANMPS